MLLKSPGTAGLIAKIGFENTIVSSKVHYNLRSSFENTILSSKVHHNLREKKTVSETSKHIVYLEVKNKADRIELLFVQDATPNYIEL